MAVEFISLDEVAKRYGVTPKSVRYAIRKKFISGTKVGWCWVFIELDLPPIWPLRYKKPHGSRLEE